MQRCPPLSGRRAPPSHRYRRRWLAARGPIRCGASRRDARREGDGQGRATPARPLAWPPPHCRAPPRFHACPSLMPASRPPRAQRFWRISVRLSVSRLRRLASVEAGAIYAIYATLRDLPITALDATAMPHRLLFTASSMGVAMTPRRDMAKMIYISSPARYSATPLKCPDIAREFRVDGAQCRPMLPFHTRVSLPILCRASHYATAVDAAGISRRRFSS